MNTKHNAPYESTGIIHHIGKIQSFSSGFAKRTLVLTDDEDSQYKNYVAFDFLKGKNKDMTRELDGYAEGEKVTVKWYINSNESSRNPGFWFTSARAIDISRYGESKNKNGNGDAKKNEPEKEEEPTIDNLPF